MMPRLSPTVPGLAVHVSLDLLGWPLRPLAIRITVIGDDGHRVEITPAELWTARRLAWGLP